MRVLFVAPRLPVPVDTGAKIRTFNIIKQVAKHCPVDLICYSFDEEDDVHVKKLKDLNVNVHLVRIEEPNIFDMAALIFFDSKPFSVTKYLTRNMEERITKVLSENVFNLVHVDHIHMVHYRHLFGNLPCMVDEHNVEYRILERCAQIEHGWKKWIYVKQAAKMRRFECEEVRKFQHCFAVSEEDQRLLTGLSYGTTPVDVIANGVDTEFFKKTGIEEETQALVFTGSMDWLPNQDAVTYFCDKVLPLIWKVKGHLKFIVVGKNPSRELIVLAETESRIEVTGSVEDVRPFMEQAKVFVCPIRIGGGTRLKILESMSMQKPVVSTTVGAEGIKHTHGENIVIADQPQEMADAIIKLLDDTNARVRIGQAAREFVVENYEWDSIGQKIIAIYQNHVKETT